MADQSAQAAKESAVLIKTSVDAVGKGVLLAEETARQLEEIADNSKIITQEVAGIAETFADQTVEIRSIKESNRSMMLFKIIQQRLRSVLQQARK